jgi:hypothetical protein
MEAHGEFRCLYRCKSFTPAIPMLTSGRPVSTWFDYSEELSEFYRYFGCLTERWPRGDDGFIPARFVVDLGSYGDLGSTMMAIPPEELRRCPVIFRGRNGDCAFSEKGRFRWFGWQRGNVKEIADSFSELLFKYIEYRSRQDALPFEAAGRRRGQHYSDDVAMSALDAILVDRAMAEQSHCTERRDCGAVPMQATSPRRR